jgi:hypothetical protein
MISQKSLSWLALSFASSSLLFLAVGLFIVVEIADSAISSRRLLASEFFWQCVVLITAYGVSTYLIATAPAASRIRRVVSWGLSVFFHLIVIVYVSQVLDWGLFVFIPLFPEAAILVVSCLGLIGALPHKDLRLTRL